MTYNDLVLAMLPWAQNRMCPKPKILIDQLQRNLLVNLIIIASHGENQNLWMVQKKLYRYLSPNSLCTYCTR